jgi:SAM-dependent methyltransferase
MHISKNPWDYLLPYAVNVFGPDVLNKEKRAAWCNAMLCAGSTLCLWNRAVELKLALLSACSLREGQKVLLVGKYANESGLAAAIGSLLGRDGNLKIEEIAPKALVSLSEVHPATGKRLQWNFSYFDAVPDESVDRVILFGAASHSGNLHDCAQHIHRVLRDGGRVIAADAPWGGKDLLTAAHMDAHLYGFVTRILSGAGIREEELPEVGAENLMTTFEPFFRRRRHFSWQGLYTFCGQKEGGGEGTLWDFPIPTEAVQLFLTEKRSQDPWDFLTDAEVSAFGPDLRESNLRKNWGRVIFFGANLKWLWANTPTITDLMYNNLRVKQGDRVMVIGEFLEELEFLPELHKRVGSEGEIAAFDIVSKSRAGYTQQWEKGPGVFIPEKHQWDYPFADSYPENYFDLLWLPQGVHHAYSWNEIAPRLLRVLKPGGQVLMAECRVPAPEFHSGLQMSGLLRYIVEKIFWAMDTTLEEMPDYSPADLARAFGDSVGDIFELDWKGWLLFWAFKK